MLTILSLLPIIFYLGLLAFIIYFAIKVIQFMGEKIRLDKEKNERLTELIKIFDQNKRN